jgi:hypothetical protein
MKATQTTKKTELKISELDENAAGLDFNSPDEIYSYIHSQGCQISREEFDKWYANTQKHGDISNTAGILIKNPT